VDDGGEGGDEADDGERGHDGEEDLGGLPHVAAPHGCFSNLALSLPRWLALLWNVLLRYHYRSFFLNVSRRAAKFID
jgi:hypothetical protein